LAAHLWLLGHLAAAIVYAVPEFIFGKYQMITEVTRRAALIGLSALAAIPVRAQTPKSNPRPSPDLATLEKTAVFELDQKSGTLKETVQKEQELFWRLKEGSNDRAIQLSNISIAFIRSVTGGQVRMSFSCNISSLGFLPADDAKLNIIARSKGGAALHTWSLGISVKCVDKDQTLSPQTHDIPDDIAPNVFTAVSTVEVAEPTGPDFPGLTVQRCKV
jgi:hypothetical protein